jgi:hypothetical protein
VVDIIHASTGEIIRELILNPAVDTKRRGAKPPAEPPP